MSTSLLVGIIVGLSMLWPCCVEIVTLNVSRGCCFLLLQPAGSFPSQSLCPTVLLRRGSYVSPGTCPQFDDQVVQGFLFSWPHVRAVSIHLHWIVHHFLEVKGWRSDPTSLTPTQTAPETDRQLRTILAAANPRASVWPYFWAEILCAWCSDVGTSTLSFLFLTVHGNSDEIDEPIKELFADVDFARRNNLMSLNSVNWSRIMVQIAHYFYAYFQCASTLDSTPLPVVEIVVPTGGGGNVTGEGRKNGLGKRESALWPEDVLQMLGIAIY